MAPTYPGITDSPTLDDWDPPFPVDLRRIRKRRRGVLGEVSNHTEGVRPAARSGSALADAIRIDDLDSCPGRKTANRWRARDDLVERLRAAADPLALGLP